MKKFGSGAKFLALFASACMLFGSISCSTGGSSHHDKKDDDKTGDSGVITLTAPEAAGAVTLVSDSDSTAKLYEGTSVQEALEYLMTNSLSGAYTINVAKGTYNEMLFYTGSATITIVGGGTASYGTDVVITYSNSGNSNAMADLASSHSVSSGYTRGATRFDGTCTVIFKNITIQNSYSRSANDGSNTQAEALVFSSTGNLIAYNSTFLSHQDTLYLGNKGGRMWFYKDYIAGDVDFIWGYMDVALFEECSIYCRGDETTKAYIFASRSMVDAAANKGIVLLNNDIEIADGVTAWYGRNSGADTNAAILNSTITGVGTLNAELYQSAPTKYVTDVAGDLAIGYKDYNNTMNGTVVDTSARLSLCGALSERVAKREYNGRYVILNRGYSESDEKYATAATIWDISDYEEEFDATEDTSSTNIYVDPVYAKNIVGGNTVQLTPSSDEAGLTYAYASSDETLATVDTNGLVTTVVGADGTAVITVTASNGNSDTMSVKVIPTEIPATGVTVTLGSETVAKYGITTATVTFAPLDTTDQSYTLTSSDSSVKFYDPSTQALATSVSAEADDGTAEIYVWVGGDVSGATLTATSTAYSEATAGTATVSATSGEATWCAQAGSYRVATDIQSGNIGLWDGLVINSKADGTIITANGKMSLKTYAKGMQTRNVVLYVPVEGASTVAINLFEGKETSDTLKFGIGDGTDNVFTANDDNTVYSYTYDGSATGIVLGSTLSDLTLYKSAGDSINANTKYLKVNVIGSSDRYITSIDVKKTGDFTATWEETPEVQGASGTYDFGAVESSSTSYTSSDTYVTTNAAGTYGTGEAGHGLKVAADNTITIKAAGIVQVDVLGCAYGNGAALTAKVGDTTIATVSSCKASTDGAVGATFYYTTDEAADIVITFTDSGFVHGIKVTNLDSFSFVTRITVSGESEVTEGKTITLTASITPEDAVVQTVSWSSSDEAVATVTSEGVVKGVAAGTATITATATDGSGITGKKEITVEAQTVDISIAYETNSYTLDLGGTKIGTNTLSITGANASDASVSYESSDTSVATVDASTGEVTAMAIGVATITATESTTAKSAMYSLVVKDTTAQSDSYKITLTTAAKSASSTGNYDFGLFSVKNGKWNDGTHGWAFSNESTITFHVNGASTITLGSCSYNSSATSTATAAAGTYSESKAVLKSCSSSYTFTYSASDAADITITFSGTTYVPYVEVASASYSSTVKAGALFDFRTLFSELPTGNSSATGSIKADGGEITYSKMYYKDKTHGAYMYQTSTITFTVSGACTIYLGKDAYNGATYTIAAVNSGNASVDSSLSATTIDAGIQNTDSAATLASGATDLTATGAAAVSFEYTGTSAATITISVTGGSATNYLPAMQVVF